MLVAIAAALGVFVCDKLLFPLLFASYFSAICWPIDGIMIGVLLLRPRAEWWWILSGYVLSQFTPLIVHGQSPLNVLLDVVSNIAEIRLAVGVLPAYTDLRAWLRYPRLVPRFTMLAILGVPVITAVFFSAMGHFLFGVKFTSMFLAWFTSDMLGIALFVPLVLVLFSRDTYDLFRAKNRWDSLLMFTALVTISWMVFHQHTYPLAFLSFAVLVVIVNRTGLSGAVLAVNLLTVIAANATIHGTGPFMFVQGPDAHRYMTLRLYLTVAMVMCFAIALTINERNDFQEQLKRALCQMETLATLDALTGLGNRRLFDLTLQTEWERAKRERRCIGLILLDADKFKPYNDFYGHVAGDHCLQAIAARIKSKVQRAGDLAARYGGEEFVVLLPGATLQQTSRVAEAIREAVEAMRLEHRANYGYYVTVSLGFNSLIPDETLMPTEFIASADEALYRAKEAGRNRVVCASMLQVPVATS